MYRSAILVFSIAACVGQPPPAPVLRISSPQRGLVMADAGKVTVTGQALPAPRSGDDITKVTVNDVTATLAADGSFTADIDVPVGAELIETAAYASSGAKAVDARAVHVGQMTPVGTGVDRAVTATLSADAFARLSAAAGPILKATDFASLLGPMQPMANVGDDLANAQISISKLALGDVKISLVPVDGGLQFSAELDALDVGAQVAYGGALVVDGSTAVTAKASQLTISGTLVVTPAGASGFTTKIASPSVRTTGLDIQASGLVGSILQLVNDNLGSTIQDAATQSAEQALEPLINDALGALAGPQQIDVLGNKLDLIATPAAIKFTSAGALVSMNVQAKIEGSEKSPGYIFTPNGTPSLDVSGGVQLALADDLVNELLAEVHAMGLLDIHLEGDYGVFDTADIKLDLPPMISANVGDGSLRLVIGDMDAMFSDHGTPVVHAAVNASVDLQILPGDSAQQIALQFGKVDVFVNAIGDGQPGGDVEGAASAGIGLQLDNLSQFLITLPVPSVAGVTLDSLSLRGDSGYVVVAGQVH